MLSTTHTLYCNHYSIWKLTIAHRTNYMLFLLIVCVCVFFSLSLCFAFAAMNVNARGKAKGVRDIANESVYLTRNQILLFSVEQRQPPTTITTRSSQPTMTMHSPKHCSAVWFSDRMFCAVALRSLSIVSPFALYTFMFMRAIFQQKKCEREKRRSEWTRRATENVEWGTTPSKWQQITLDKTRDMCFLLEVYNKFSINSGK